MTEKRYSDGTLAKWYYSQTNVISDGDNEYYLRNKESVKDLNYDELLGTNDLLDELNRLSDENDQLKISSIMYYELFKELQRQMRSIKSIHDLDSKDFEDLIKLSKGNVFDDKLGWIHLPIEELKE